MVALIDNNQQHEVNMDTSTIRSYAIDLELPESEGSVVVSNDEAAPTCRPHLKGGRCLDDQDDHPRHR